MSTQAPKTLRGVVLALTLLVGTGAFADAAITLDGSNADWAAVTGCIAGPLGSQGLILSRVCLTNNNSASNTGSMYFLYETTTNIPTNQDSYFGFAIDVNQDGTLDGSDEVYAAFWPANAAAPSALVVYQYNNYNSPKRTYGTTASCGGTTGANGWNAARNGKVFELSVAYGCLAIANCNDGRLMQMGVYPELNSSGSFFYNGSQDVLSNEPTTVPESQLFTAVSGSGKVTLNWTNPPQHNGVVILRSTSAIAANTKPKDGSTYTTGGNGPGGTGTTVAYADANSCATTFSDSGLTNGTRYYYRVYNHYEGKSYAAGAVPSTSGLFSEPTTRVSPSPLYCYSVGMANLQQPVTLTNTAVYTSGNAGAVTANQTSTNTSVDGQELWRPVQLAGSDQSRFPIVPLYNRSGNWILTGDQAGNGCVINAATGALAWPCKSVGSVVQAQPGVQLRNYANAAFQSANPSRDLIFFTTRNASTTNNRVVALSSVDGSTVWTYAPGDLDIIAGGVLVDYTNNQLWVASRAGAGTTNQASLRVLSTLTGAVLSTFKLGAIDYGVNQDFASGQAYVVTNAGSVYGFNLSTRTQVWTFSLGSGVTATSYAFPTGNGFIATWTQSGSGFVRRYSVSGSTVTSAWAAATSIANPSGVTVQYSTQTTPGRIFVGSSDSKVHQLNETTGVDEKQRTLSSQTGTPSVDATALRLSVGTQDGRLCVFQLPW